MFSKQSYVYKTTVTREIHADVYRPTDQHEVRPAILWLHGGALIFGHRAAISPDQLERYVKAGYTVISVDYRLAPETKLAAIIEDLQDAYRWLRAQGPNLFQIDPERVAVIGHSAGGYLTLMAGFCLDPRPQALVSFYGYGDIVGPWYSRPDPFYCQEAAVPKETAYQSVGEVELTGSSGEQRWYFYLYCRQQGLWPEEVTGHNPDKEPQQFDRFCPIRNISQEYPPTLLMHGTEDTDVPFEQSRLMSRELERHGVEHKLIALSGRGHGFDKAGAGLQDPEIAAVFDQIVAFLKKYESNH